MGFDVINKTMDPNFKVKCGQTVMLLMTNSQPTAGTGAYMATDTVSMQNAAKTMFVDWL